MKIEDASYYIINKSLEMANINQDNNYLVDFEKLIYLLSLIEYENLKNTNEQLFDESFIISSRGILLGHQDGFNFDFEYNDYLKNKLFIFIDMYNDYYTTPTFSIEIENQNKFIIEKVLNDYNGFSTNELKNLIIERFGLKDLLGYKILKRI